MRSVDFKGVPLFAIPSHLFRTFPSVVLQHPYPQRLARPIQLQRKILGKQRHHGTILLRCSQL